jgi:membrane-bound serine protease (ClpP class)
VVLHLTGVVDPIAADYILRSLDRADRQDAAVCVITIDTPGGLDTSMREIAESILAARTPVVAFVSPQGARAASAGVFVAFASGLIAMAPSTSIGAAHPVDTQGNAASDKITNDAASYLRTLAARTGRPLSWTDDVVRKSVSSTASEAESLHVADLIAQDVPSLLRAIDGRTVPTGHGPVRLSTREAPLKDVQMNGAERFLHVVAHPNVAYLLFMLGFYALLIEFSHPGINFAGVFGAVCIILALVAFEVLNVSLGGVLLLLLAVVLLVWDITAPTHGVLTAGGLMALVMGSMLLARGDTVAVQVSAPLAVTLCALTALVSMVALRAGWRAQRLPLYKIAADLPGPRGVAVTDLRPTGIVRAGSEQWTAVTDTSPIDKGEAVQIVAREGLVLRVRRAGDDVSAASGTSPAGPAL